MALVRRHLNDGALALAALLLSLRAALSAASLGDYPGDAGPPIGDLVHGNLHAFALARPAMGDLSLLVRLPFAGLASLAHAGELTSYRWGAVPCVLSVAALALWLARIAARRGAGLVAQWAIVLLALLNPLVSSALDLGHPEELLTASLCVGALVAAIERKALLSTVLLGLALACKQWSVVAVLPVLFALDGARLKALLGALATALLVTLPAIAGAPSSFLHNQLDLAQSLHRSPTIWSWLWPPAPDSTRHVLVEGNSVAVSGHRLPAGLARAVHPLLIAVDLLVAAVVACVRRLPLRRDDAFALMALVLLLRCTLDTETMPYYLAGLLLDLLAWDALRGERLPVRALAGAAVAYVLCDRVWALSPSVCSFLYGACTLIAALLFAGVLAGRRARRPRPVGLRLRPTA
ncbi:MAG TPA: glycosyltransferase 87 family protein [Solirubrobacteraceae bacterium]|nr:glycosyltransferase 87 family protein [Solirubrobacteraceae bacterium]